jgi:monoamine oxidase
MKKVVIIGAGISGLYLGYRLKKQGYSIKILEANHRIGGRIFTKTIDKTKIELGASWLWRYNPELLKLCKELNISLFEQSMKGDALFEANNNFLPQRFQLPKNQEISYRIIGGTKMILEKLINLISDDELYLNEKVIKISDHTNTVHIKTENSDFDADIVISTIPPQLLINTIQFYPELDNELIKIANNTHTWMKDSIKFAVVYKNPFWREKGLSGTGFSNTGPFTELYDHSNFKNNSFALMGFLNNNLISDNKNEREEKVKTQLEKFFGPQGKEYLSYEEKIWHEEELTNFKNNHYINPHHNNGHSVYQNSFLNNKLIIGGTETSEKFGGYMEGAIIRGNQIVNNLNNN